MDTVLCGKVVIQVKIYIYINLCFIIHDILLKDFTYTRISDAESELCLETQRVRDIVLHDLCLGSTG